MDETMLAVKSGVTLTEQDGKIGLTLRGRTQFAKDTRQAEILRVLISQSQPLESIMTLFHTLDNPLRNDNEISLTIAEFILDFGDYLET